MIGKSLFIGNTVEWTALDSEKDAAEISIMTTNLQFCKTFFEKPARPYTVSEVKKKIKSELKSADEKRNCYFFAIRKKGESELVCLLRFGWLRLSHQDARLYLDFTSLINLKEYGDEILSMALRFGFMELSLHRIWAEIPGYCKDEINLFEAAGCLRDVQRREASFFNGQYYDLITYSILKPEWKKLQQLESAMIQEMEVAA